MTLSSLSSLMTLSDSFAPFGHFCHFLTVLSLLRVTLRRVEPRTMLGTHPDQLSHGPSDGRDMVYQGGVPRVGIPVVPWWVHLPALPGTVLSGTAVTKRIVVASLSTAVTTRIVVASCTLRKSSNDARRYPH